MDHSFDYSIRKLTETFLFLYYCCCYYDWIYECIVCINIKVRLQTIQKCNYDDKRIRCSDFMVIPWHEKYWYGGCAWCLQSQTYIHRHLGTWHEAWQGECEFLHYFHMPASHSIRHRHLHHHHRCGGLQWCNQTSSNIQHPKTTQTLRYYNIPTPLRHQDTTTPQHHSDTKIL